MTIARAFLYLAALFPLSVSGQKPPDFGPNVLLITPATPRAEAQAAIDRIYATQQHNEFGAERNAILLMPGEYKLNVPVGFYTEVRGVGASPDATHVTGDVHSDASLPRNNATCTFWRGVENFAVTPVGGAKEGEMQWAVSQAVPMRRMHVRGDLVLHQKGGWASGGWMSDSLTDGTVASGPQQQWISRNSEWKQWTGTNWNMVFVGVPQAPAGDWPKPAYTRIAVTPVVREKPYLVYDKGKWSVRVPALGKDSSGITWKSGETAGVSIPLSSFYIAHAERDTAATMNAQLAKGKHLLLTPGIYSLTEPLRVTRAKTVVLGLGFATLKTTAGTAAMTVASVDGVTVAGVLFDAGETLSPVLLEVGAAGDRARHAADPIALFDVFFRIGGAGVGKATTSLVVNAADTIVDHTWIWRADHGAGVGWEKNLSDHGLIVNADDVTVYGLFVEHHEKFQVLWNGERGRTYFYQSEIPYDPPTQTAYTSAAGVHGWAAYKVADGVRAHEAWGMGIYSVFRQPNVFLTRAIETPVREGVRFHDMITVCLGNNGGIENVVDDEGGATQCKPRIDPQVTEFPAGR